MKKLYEVVFEGDELYNMLLSEDQVRVFEFLIEKGYEINITEKGKVEVIEL